MEVPPPMISVPVALLFRFPSIVTAANLTRNSTHLSLQHVRRNWLVYLTYPLGIHFEPRVYKVPIIISPRQDNTQPNG